jgi:4-alpha-glucanotransferase
VIDDSLARLAAAYGVATSYSDWRGEVVPVPGETVEAAVRALEPERPVVPGGRSWGFMVQLYSLRSRDSWAYGDLRDLADLAAWSANALGAGFVLINPLHADDPVPPIEPSPYLPVSRRFSSPLYLRVEDVPEYATAAPRVREGIAALAAPLRAADHTLDPIDREAVWAAKRAALELLHALPLSAARQAAFDAFREREGAALRTFATWCALAEAHGGDWRRWPEPLRDPESGEVAAQRTRLAGRIAFYSRLQWLLDDQLAAAQRAARDAGMPIGIVHDLALGVHPGGADAWMYQRFLAHDMRVGAPPDEFNQRGQEWGFPPWHPGRLAAAGYEPLRDMLRHILRHGGGVRIDHVMQLFRLWWVPLGAPPAGGAYVRYDHLAMLEVIGTEARRAGALVIGEDLGTVEEWMRTVLAECGLLGTSMLWFEQDHTGRPRPPADWRELCLATIGTHDMPPVAGFLPGDHVELRARLGLLARPVAEEAADHRERVAAWTRTLAELGLLGDGDGDGDGDDEGDDEGDGDGDGDGDGGRGGPVAEGGRGGPEDGPEKDGEDGDGDAGGGGDSGEHDGEVLRMTVALHAFLARTRARLIGVSLADAVGERRTQNQPGTADEYPNWRLPLADGAGVPVLLEALPSNERVRAVVAPVARAVASPDG